MPEVMAAASTTPPTPTTASIDPDTTVGPGQPFTLNTTIIGDDGSIPAGTFKGTDPYNVSGAGGTSKSSVGGAASFTFTAPATPPNPNSELFTVTFTPTDQVAYVGSSDVCTVTFSATQVTKVAPSITFS